MYGVATSKRPTKVAAGEGPVISESSLKSMGIVRSQIKAGATMDKKQPAT